MEITGLLEKNISKVITYEEVLSSIQVFNSCFIDEIKDLCSNKVIKKS